MAMQQHMMQKAMEQQLLTVANAMEEKIDAEMAELDELENDEDALERIRQKRLMELKNHQDKRNEYLRAGHGKLNEINSDKDFFEEAKGSKRLVCHFYRNTTMRCKILDEHLKKLAQQHVETKFLKLDVDKCDWIIQRLKIHVIPTLAFIKDGKTGDYMRGFEDVGGIDDFSTEMLEWRCGLAGVINYKGDLKTPPDQRKKTTRGTKIIRGKQNERDESDDEAGW